MTLLTGILHLFCCLFTARVGLRLLIGLDVAADGAWRVSEQLLGTFVVFLTAFLLPFHILGAWELATGNSVVTIPHAAAVSLTTTCVLWGLARRVNPVGTLQSAPLARQWCDNRRLFYVSAAGFLFVACLLISEFPRGWEAMGYHLPIGVRIFRDHTLTPWTRAFTHTHPANASLVFGFLLQIVPERFVAASNLLFLPVFALGVYSTARALDADQATSSIVALATASVPLITYCGRICEADVGGLACAAAALHFGVARWRGNSGSLILAGLAIGLAYGFKAVHLVSFLFIGAFVLLGPSRTGSVLVTRLSRPAIYLICGIATCGFWLTRNWLTFGSPVYPLNLPVVGNLFGFPAAQDTQSIASIDVVWGWVDSPWRWLLYPWDERYGFQGKTGIPGVYGTDLGPFFAAAVYPAAALILVTCYSTRSLAAKPLVFLLGGAFVLAAWAYGGSRQPQYAIGAFAYLGPLVGWAATQLQPAPKSVFRALLGMAILWNMFVVTSHQAAEWAGALYHHQLNRPGFYQYPESVDELQSDAVIINATKRPWNYGLLGKHLSNRVVDPLSIDKLDPFSEDRAVIIERTGDYFDNPPTRIRLEADTLSELQAGYVFVFADTAIELEAGVELDEVDRHCGHSRETVLYKLRYAADRGPPVSHANDSSDSS